MTYLEIATMLVPNLEKYNSLDYERILFLIGHWIDEDGMRAVVFPDAQTIKEWDGDEAHLSAYLRQNSMES